MHEYSGSAARSVAITYPDAVALIRHLIRYAECDRLLLAGEFQVQFEAELAQDGFTGRVVKLSGEASGLGCVSDTLISERTVLVARSANSAYLQTKAFRTLIGLCQYTVVVGSPAGVTSEHEFQGGLIPGIEALQLFSGIATSKDGVAEPLWVFGNVPLSECVPREFRVAAIIAAYNEADVIAYAIDHLLGQGIGVYFIDNWSTDGTFQLVSKQFGSRLLGMERFPLNAPLPTFDLFELLKRKEQLAMSIDASWIIHQDADEFRYSPFTGLTLRHGLYVVDRSGYSAVNHTIIEFPPTGDAIPPQGSPERHLTRFRFGLHPFHLIQVKAWKKTGVPITLAAKAGHQVKFDGMRIYPFNFLLKHYPIRSQEQGRRKVFSERLPRYSPAGQQRGWHVHYRKLQEGHDFAELESVLEAFDERDFERRFLVQRLTGCGIHLRLNQSR